MDGTDEIKNDIVNKHSGEILPDGTVRMKRQISLLGGISLLVGTIIGSGIFITPTELLRRTDSAAWSLVVWAGCGILSTLAALSYCELGTLVPRSGGEHAYFMEAFGSLHSYYGQIPAFLYSWMLTTLIKPCSVAILALAVGKYTILPFIRFGTICCWWNQELNYTIVQKLLAIFCILTVASINSFSIKLTEKLIIILSFAKLFACSIVLIIGAYNLIIGEYGGLPVNGFDSSNATFGQTALAFYGGLWTYNGWHNINILTEELINPFRNLPLAMIISISLVTFIYVFMNVSYLTIMSKDQLLASSAVGIDVGEHYLGPIKLIIPILVTLSVLGAAVGSNMAAGRITYVGARDGHLPSILSYVHIKWLTPIISLSLNAGLSIILVIFQDISELIDAACFTQWIFYGLTMIALLVLRIRQPSAKRPIKIPVVIPIIVVVVTGGLLMAPIMDNPRPKHFIPLIYCIVGLFVYTLFVYKEYNSSYADKITNTVQIFAMVAPSPYKQDQVPM